MTSDEYKPIIHLPETDSELLAECVVETFRASGPGGQHVNTTDSAVRLTHLPSQIVVTCQESRSQLMNKERCLKKLRDEVKQRNYRPKKRIPTKVSKRKRRKRVESKRKHGDKKRMRKKP